MRSDGVSVDACRVLRLKTDRRVIDNDPIRQRWLQYRLLADSVNEARLE